MIGFLSLFLVLGALVLSIQRTEPIEFLDQFTLTGAPPAEGPPHTEPGRRLLRINSSSRGDFENSPPPGKIMSAQDRVDIEHFFRMTNTRSAKLEFAEIARVGHFVNLAAGIGFLGVAVLFMIRVKQEQPIRRWVVLAMVLLPACMLFSGLLAGTELILDNASTIPVAITLDGEPAGRLAPMSYASVRLTGGSHTVEVKGDGRVLETGAFRLESNLPETLVHAFAGPRTYVYNLFGANEYYDEEFSYR